MILSERSLLVGRWLRARRRWMPLIVVVMAVVTLFFARPFTMIHDSWLHNMLCLLISCAGIAVRFVTVGYLPEKSCECNRPEPDNMMWIDKTGMYSLMRHPLHVGTFLMWLGLVLYVGVGWFMVGVALLLVMCYEKIIIAEEDDRTRRLGDAYAEWCGLTSAVWPRWSQWVPSERPFSVLRAMRIECNGIMWLGLSYAVVDLMKNMSRHFSFGFSDFWLAVLIIVLLFVLLVKVILRMSDGNNKGGGASCCG